jgi:uncharacterized Zn finger protein
MNDLPRLAESKIQQWIGDASFRRGVRYYRQGRILNPRRQAETLKALCSGSQPEPYRVKIRLDLKGILAGHCSCPVGRGGRCKHAAALLLTWLHKPERFHEMEDLETSLAQRSKSDLVTLIVKMIGRYPDLEMLLELPTPGGSETRDALEPDLIHRQVNVAFSRAGDDWRSGARASADLLDVVSLGDEYAERGNWRNAAIVYETVARDVLENYGMVYDDEGELNYVVYECTRGLARCFEASDAPVHREGLLQALFHVYRWDVDSGGYGIGDDVPDRILELANIEERRKVAEWVQSALPGGDSWRDNHHRQVYGAFLLALLEDELDDESFLQISRETGRFHDLVDRLLTLNRADEAQDAARGASDHELIHLADLFVSHGQAALGEQLVRERTESSNDSRLITWLKARAEESGDAVAALAFAEAFFWQRASTSAYADMKRLAEPLAQWTPKRAKCLRRLEQEGNFALLTEIYVLEEEIDRALEVLEQYSQQHRWGTNPLALRVAQAAEQSRPREAIRLYLEEVERLIAGRGRGNYAEAANYLLRVRAVFEQMGEEKAWHTLIANLREKNRRLPAMQDEFNQAGL